MTSTDAVFRMLFPGCHLPTDNKTNEIIFRIICENQYYLIRNYNSGIDSKLLENIHVTKISKSQNRIPWFFP